MVSKVAPDGSLLEMIHDTEAGSTSFVRWKDGQYEVIPELELSDGLRAVPYSPRNNLLEHSVVLFSKAPEEYGTESDLVGKIQSFIHRYVDLSPLFERLATYYVLLSWLYDSFQELPYLGVRGDPGTGKTRFLLTVGSLCYKPIFASGASTVSPLFRILDAMRGTLVIDESDFRFSDEKAEIVKIFNNGNVKGFPVLRTDVVPGSKEFNPRAYHVFGPKLIASRGPFDDPALESRLLTEEMGNRGLREDVPINLPPAHAAESLTIRNHLLLFRFRNLQKPRELEDFVDRTMEPRLNQVFAPLLSVVEDPQTRDDLRRLAREYHREMVADRSLGIEAELVEVIRSLWQGLGTPPSIKEIGTRFGELHGVNHRNLTAKRLGWILRRKLGLETTRRGGTYFLSATEESKLCRLYDRYGLDVSNLPPEPAA